MSQKRYCVYYVNGNQFLGRWNGYWTRSDHIDGAGLFEDEYDADAALQAFRAEFHEKDHKNHASWMFDFYGGVLEIREVEITRSLVLQPWNPR